MNNSPYTMNIELHNNKYLPSVNALHSPETTGAMLDYLIINGNMVKNNGLLYGKTGIALCIFHYFRITGNEVYEDYAGMLTDIILTGILSEESMQYDNGLPGICSGINYLISNGFLETKEDNFLQILEDKMRKELRSRPDVAALFGIGKYFLYKIRNGTVEGRDEAEKVIAGIAREIVLSEGLVKKTELPSVVEFLIDIYNKNICRSEISEFLNGLFDREIGNKSLSQAWLPAMIKFSCISDENRWKQKAAVVIQKIIDTPYRDKYLVMELFTLLKCNLILRDEKYFEKYSRLSVSKIDIGIKALSSEEKFAYDEDMTFKNGCAGAALLLSHSFGRSPLADDLLSLV